MSINFSSKVNDSQISKFDYSIDSSRYPKVMTYKKNIRLENNESFQGDFVYEGDKYVKKGYGIYKYPNDDIYEGEWERDKKNGLGEYKYADGSIYRGEWKDDMKHGIGTMIGNDQHEFEGVWEKDELRDAFIYKTSFSGEVEYDEEDKIRIDSKKSKLVFENDNLINLERNIWNSFDWNNQKFYEKIEKKNNFSIQIELLAFIKDYHNQYEDILEKCNDFSMCENCISKNNKKKIKFDFKCKKISSFLKLFFKSNSNNQN